MFYSICFFLKVLTKLISNFSCFLFNFKCFAVFNNSIKLYIFQYDKLNQKAFLIFWVLHKLNRKKVNWKYFLLQFHTKLSNHLQLYLITDLQVKKSQEFIIYFIFNNFNFDLKVKMKTFPKLKITLWLETKAKLS